jgi:hypothetical protein
MKRGLKLGTMITLLPILACIAGNGQDIIDDWANVQVPPSPELKKVTVDPKTTALLVMGFVVDSCNSQRRPRCAATIPHVLSSRQIGPDSSETPERPSSGASGPARGLDAKVWAGTAISTCRAAGFRFHTA